MKFKRLGVKQFKRLRTGRQFIGLDTASANTDRTVFQFRRSHKVAVQISMKTAARVPAFIYHCDNVLNIEKRIAFRTDVPYPLLLCCTMCDPKTIKLCQAYDWVGEGWE